MPSDRNDKCTKFHGIFIRAPGIVTVDNKKDVKVLATLNTFSREVKQTSCNGTNGFKGIFGHHSSYLRLLKLQIYQFFK